MTKRTTGKLVTLVFKAFKLHKLSSSKSMVRRVHSKDHMLPLYFQMLLKLTEHKVWFKRITQSLQDIATFQVQNVDACDEVVHLNVLKIGIFFVGLVSKVTCLV